MTQRSQIRTWFAFLCVALVVMAFAGCGKKNPTKIIATPIDHQDADDIAQSLAAAAASDGGGWYFVVQQLADSLATATTNAPVTPDTNVFTLGPQAGNTYNVDAAYFNNLQVGYPVRDTTSSELEANVHLNGGTLSLAGVQGQYFLHADWGFFVYNLKSVYDTLEFSNVLEDSSLVTVTSTITPGRTKFWYHTNSLYTTLFLKKSLLPGNPYPVSGSVEYLLDAYNMKSLSHDIVDDVDHEILVEALLTFNGTENATLNIVDFLGENDWQWNYSVNLKTGAITRLN